MNIHANARLTLRPRRDVVELMIVGFPVERDRRPVQRVAPDGLQVVGALARRG